MFERIFKLSEHKTTVKTEVMAGITTFMTMAYILAVNPSVLGSTGMDTTAVLLATALASCLGTLCMAFMANLPFALSAGMGLNAFMAYTVVAGYGYSWQVALLAVFIEGLIFIVLSLTNVREAIFNAIPLTLKKGVSVGIGLFIAFIGLQNSGLCVDSATLVGIISFPENFHTAGICALLTLIGLFFTAVFYTRKMKGAILYGILLTWILGMLCQVTGLYVPTPDAGFYSLFPSWGMTDFSRLGLTFGQCFNVDFSAVGIVNFIVVIFSFLFVDIFDTLGTLIGVATKAKMLDKDGKPVPDGEAGEICVRGSGLASGYFGNWEKTNECFIQNPTNPYFRDILYRTGDIAVKKDDGLLYFLSRQDGQIKHMGYRIELGEIETALHSVDGIAAAACLFDRNRDRIVCIYEGEPDAAALARAMRRLVPKYMLPNIYEKLDALPMNANGKIDRVKLKEQFIHAED